MAVSLSVFLSVFYLCVHLSFCLFHPYGCLSVYFSLFYLCQSVFLCLLYLCPSVGPQVLEMVLDKRLSSSLATLYGPHMTCHLSLVQAHLFVSLADTIPVIPKMEDVM